MADLPAAWNYDRQARENYWHPEALFGLVYEYLQPGDRLLDIGIGTGLASQPFARAGAIVSGVDSDPGMLAVCRAKGIAAELQEHDLSRIPWPFEDGAFCHALACGVLHFVGDLAPVFQEVDRLLRPRGTFTFTYKMPPDGTAGSAHPDQPLAETIQDTTLYLHPRTYLERLIRAHGFEVLKELRLLIRTGRGSDDLFLALVTRKL